MPIVRPAARLCAVTNRNVAQLCAQIESDFAKRRKDFTISNTVLASSVAESNSRKSGERFSARNRPDVKKQDHVTVSIHEMTYSAARPI